MLKVVVFDGGYGGEIFADFLEQSLPVVETIRVIDWRNAGRLLESPRKARRVAKDALRPYIGRADLVVIANHLVALTGLKYLRKVFPKQEFIGLELPELKEHGPDWLKAKERETESKLIVLTTEALRKTLEFQKYLFRLKRRAVVITEDDWVGLIDDGELTRTVIELAFCEKGIIKDSSRKEIILACSQFNDLKPVLRKIFGLKHTRIYDSFDDAILEVNRVLKIRGGRRKKK